MHNRLHVRISKDKIAHFCRRHHIRDIRELALLGSVLRGDFRADSDVDVLVEFEPEAHYGLSALARMQSELEGIAGPEVHLVERPAIENSRNYIRRKAILSSAETIYVARIPSLPDLSHCRPRRKPDGASLD